MEIKGSKLYNLYLGIVSFVSIIAIGITLGVVLTSVGKYFFISDEEYLQYNQSYRLDVCKGSEKQATYDKTGNVISLADTPSEEEIQKCEAKVREEVKFSRTYNLKDMFLTSIAWFIVFLILFFFHYPKFLKMKKED